MGKSRSTRDEFLEPIKQSLAKRVAYVCSRPDCGQQTIGPSDESATATASVGVAAHITAAAAGGRRFDPNLTEDERSSFENGIWLCATCATLVDRDEATYTVERLRCWKSDAEARASQGLTRSLPTPGSGPMGYARIRDMILDSNPGSFIRSFDGPSRIRFRLDRDVQLEIVVRDRAGSFDEPWIRRFPAYRLPPQSASRAKVEIRYDSKKLGEFEFLYLDGARYLLPLPTAGSEQQIDFMQAALGRIVAPTSGYSFEEGVQRGQVKIVREHACSRREWPRGE